MRLLVSIASLAALLACGCSGGGPDRNRDTSTLNRGIVVEPESLDAHKAKSIQAADVLRDIGEGLLSYTETGELTGGVAERWEMSDDGLAYTFYLRPEAKWSNGDALIAAHFEFGLERLVAPETAAFYAQFLPTMSGVDAVDDRTLVIALQQPAPYLLSLLTHPATFPMHPGAIAKHGDKFARPGNLLSNGAYVLEDWIPGSLITLQRNEHYWNNGATAIDTVRHHVVVQAATELARYRSGEIDITGTIPPDSIAMVQEELPDQVRLSPSLGIYYYGFNLSRPPFKDNLKLRQALSMAIDRELLVKEWTGRGEAPAYGWVPPGVDNYTPASPGYAKLTQTERNQLAQRLYLEAGYSRDNPLQVEVRYNTADTEQKVALAVQAMWRGVLGVEATIINEEFQVLQSNISDREITQVFRSSWSGDYNDALTFLGIMQSDNVLNQTGYASTRYDALMQQAATQPEPGKRRRLLEEAERTMLAGHPAIPLYFYVSKHMVSPRVDGWGDNVLNYHYSQHLSLKAVK